MGKIKTWDWFAAALLHDIKKIILARNGAWAHHADLAKPLDGDDYPYLAKDNIHEKFVDILGQDLVDHIRVHDQDAVREKYGGIDATVPKEVVALVMADGFQKAMHQIPGGIEKDERFNHLKYYPAFYPYYGPPIKSWQPSESATATRAMVADLRKVSRLCELLEFLRNDYFTRFPHTTYIPHISLSIHLRFTAAIFYFVYKKLQGLTDPTDLRKISFSLITVRPETLGLFYRLRDVKVHRKAVAELRKSLFHKVFVKCQREGPLSGLGPGVNPFEFFTGNSLVLAYDDADQVIAALQETLDEEASLRSLDIKWVEYALRATWEQKNGKWGFYARPEDVETTTRAWTLMANDYFIFPEETEGRCSKCTRPSKDLQLDERGDLLCPRCRALPKEGVVDIGKVSGGQRVGFIFLSLPEDLREHALEVAEHELVPAFMSQRGVEPRILRPTKGGLFEYLQAVLDIEKFQANVEKVLGKMREGKNNRDSAYTLLAFPNLMVYILREDQYWKFLNYINEERGSLKLQSSLRAILCHPKTPIWSLMEALSKHTEGDIYYDASGGSVVMFTPKEVEAIRNLAAVAASEGVRNKQLNDLSEIAMVTNAAELGLKIDIRAKEHKIGRRFPNLLKKALEELSSRGDDFKDREKRALFIKHVVKLKRGEKRERRRRR